MNALSIQTLHVTLLKKKTRNDIARQRNKIL